MSTTKTKAPEPRSVQVSHEFVEFIPETLVANTIYISIPYATSAHACLCGCGTKVVTPISPTGWELTFDGDTISLSPSVGNWSQKCRAHYWVERNVAVWAPSMTDDEIAKGRSRDRALTQAYFGKTLEVPLQSRPAPTKRSPKQSFLKRLLRKKSREESP
jgi:Family of unknown function (DUF6527)